MINVNFLSATREEIVAGNDLSKLKADTRVLTNICIGTGREIPNKLNYINSNWKFFHMYKSCSPISKFPISIELKSSFSLCFLFGFSRVHLKQRTFNLISVLTTREPVSSHIKSHNPYSSTHAHTLQNKSWTKIKTIYWCMNIFFISTLRIYRCDRCSGAGD